MNTLDKLIGGLFVTSVLFVILGIPAFFELGGLTSFGIKPYAAYAVFWGALVLSWRLPRRMTLSILVSAFLGLIILHVTPWTPGKVFLRHFDRVEVGMTIEEVEAVMQGYELREALYPSGEMVRAFFHDRNDGRYDSECWAVTFTNGRVSERRFTAD